MHGSLTEFNTEGLMWVAQICIAASKGQEWNESSDITSSLLQETLLGLSKIVYLGIAESPF